MLNSFFLFLSSILFVSFVKSSIPSNLVPYLININAGWSELAYNMTKSPWIGNDFKIVAPVPLMVLYSDAYCPGEMVSIFVNGSFLMNSTSVPIPSASCSPNIPLPMGTFVYPQTFSHANFTLPIGNHSIAVKVIQYDSRNPQGIMYMRAYTPISFNCTAAPPTIWSHLIWIQYDYFSFKCTWRFTWRFMILFLFTFIIFNISSIIQ